MSDREGTASEQLNDRIAEAMGYRVDWFTWKYDGHESRHRVWHKDGEKHNPKHFDTDAGDAWRLVCWLIASNATVCVSGLSCTVSYWVKARHGRVEHDGTEPSIMAALCESAEKALESEAGK